MPSRVRFISYVSTRPVPKLQSGFMYELACATIYFPWLCGLQWNLSFSFSPRTWTSMNFPGQKRRRSRESTFIVQACTLRLLSADWKTLKFSLRWIDKPELLHASVNACGWVRAGRTGKRDVIEILLSTRTQIVLDLWGQENSLCFLKKRSPVQAQSLCVSALFHCNCGFWKKIEGERGRVNKKVMQAQTTLG